MTATENFRGINRQRVKPDRCEKESVNRWWLSTTLSWSLVFVDPNVSGTGTVRSSSFFNPCRSICHSQRLGGAQSRTKQTRRQNDITQENFLHTPGTELSRF